MKAFKKSLTVLLILSIVNLFIPKATCAEPTPTKHPLEIRSTPEEDIPTVKEKKTKEGKDWYIGPRIGDSFFTGVVGAELQIGHIALDISSKEGGVDIGGGIKYYFHPYKSASFLGVGGVKSSISEEYNDYEQAVLGFMVGNRWRWRGGWDFSIGLGWVKGTRRYTKGWNKDKVEKQSRPTFEIAFGYSF